MRIQTFLVTFFLFTTAYNVSAQFNGRVEFLAPPPATISATSYVQPTGQFVVPAVIKPLIGSEIISQPPSVPSYPEYNHYKAPFLPHHMPIFMGGGSRDDDDWHHLLYFLIFANMRNRWDNGYGYNGYGNSGGCGCGCGNSGCGNSGCGCDSGCNNYGGDSGCNNYGGDCGCNNYGGDCGCSNRNGVTYIPYPIPVPMSSIPFYPGLTTGTVDTSPNQISDDYFGPTIQAYAGNDPNEITLMIRTDS